MPIRDQGRALLGKPGLFPRPEGGELSYRLQHRRIAVRGDERQEFSFQQGQGSVTTVEGTIAYELPAVMKIVPTIGGTIGGQFGDAGSIDKPYVFANGKDSYTYWNAGLALAIDKLTLDFRYWDTSIPNSNLALGSTNFCNQDLFGCDGRFVASAKVTF